MIIRQNNPYQHISTMTYIIVTTSLLTVKTQINSNNCRLQEVDLVLPVVAVKENTGLVLTADICN